MGSFRVRAQDAGLSGLDLEGLPRLPIETRVAGVQAAGLADARALLLGRRVAQLFGGEKGTSLIFTAIESLNFSDVPFFPWANGDISGTTAHFILGPCWSFPERHAAVGRFGGRGHA